MNYLMLFIYLIILLFIGVWASRKISSENFLIADRKTDSIKLAFSICAGFFDGFVLVSYTGYVYKYGWPAISLFIGTVIGFILFYCFADKIYKEGAEHKYYGLSDFIERRYGRSSSLIVSTINLIFYVSLLLIQLIFGGTIITALTGWNYNLCVTLVGGTILIYVALGGLQAVLTTDRFQWILIIAIGLFLLPLLIREGASGSLNHADFKGGANDAIGFLLIGSLAVFSAPELWQKCFAGRNAASVKKAMIISGVAFPFIGVLLATIGFYAFAHYPNIDPQTALISVFDKIFTGNLSGIGLILLLAAIMSTADTCLFVIAPTFTLNVMNVKHEDRKSTTIIITVVAMSIAMLLAMLTKDILKIALTLASFSLALFPVLFVGLITVLTPRTVSVSLLLGVLTVVVMIFNGEMSPLASAASLPVVFTAVIIGWASNKWIFKKVVLNNDY